MHNNDELKLKLDRFIFHRVKDVAGEALQKLWILFFVNGTKDCRLDPPTGIDDWTVRDFTCEVISGESFTFFEGSDECLAEKYDGQQDSNAVALIFGLREMKKIRICSDLRGFEINTVGPLCNLKKKWIFFSLNWTWAQKFS